MAAQANCLWYPNREGRRVSMMFTRNWRLFKSPTIKSVYARISLTWGIAEK